MTRWKYIKGYDKAYKLSEYGEVISCGRKMWNGKVYWKSRARVMTPYLSKVGYYTFALSKGGKTKLVYVHRLLGGHFIRNPDNKPQINHKDGNKKNNSLSNLEWVSVKENVHHARENGLSRDGDHKGEKNSQSKIGKDVAMKVRERKGKEMLKTTAQDFGISITQVWAIQNNKSWKHI